MGGSGLPFRDQKTFNVICYVAGTENKNRAALFFNFLVIEQPLFYVDR